jgi:hypothetical protein
MEHVKDIVLTNVTVNGTSDQPGRLQMATKEIRKEAKTALLSRERLRAHEAARDLEGNGVGLRSLGIVLLRHPLFQLFTPSPGLGEINGRVVNARDGEPLSGASGTAGTEFRAIWDDGAFRLTGVPPAVTYYNRPLCFIQ